MKKLVLTIGIFLFLSVTIKAQPNANSAQNNKNAPQIKFENVVYDYGTIFQNGDGNCEFKFKNTGKEPLILTTVRSSCGCTVPKWPQEPILPGKSAAIKVKYDTRRLGIINKQITVRSNAIESTIVLRIKGKITTKPKETVPAKQLDKNSSPVMK